MDYDLEWEEGIQKFYDLTVNFKISFDGKCLKEETFREVNIDYQKSVIRAVISERSNGHVTDRTYHVYKVSLDPIEQGEFCKVPATPTQTP